MTGLSQTENFNLIYEDYFKRNNFQQDIDFLSRAHLPLRNAINRQLAKLVYDDPKILEIGCGSSIDTSILAGEFPRLRFYGIDISPKGIKVAKEIGRLLNARVNLSIQNAKNLAFKDESFGLIFSQGVLEHFVDDETVMREQIRVLKKGGFLIIDVPQKFTYFTLIKHLQIKRGTWPWGWEKEYSCADLRRLGARFDLMPIEVLGYGYDRITGFLRDPYQKLHDKNPLRDKGYFRLIYRIWQNLFGSQYGWLADLLEKKAGHYFLKSIIMVFEK